MKWGRFQSSSSLIGGDGGGSPLPEEGSFYEQGVIPRLLFSLVLSYCYSVPLFYWLGLLDLE